MKWASNANYQYVSLAFLLDLQQHVIHLNSMALASTAACSSLHLCTAARRLYMVSGLEHTPRDIEGADRTLANEDMWVGAT